MNGLNYYCPKCGEKLVDRSNRTDELSCLYVCDSCKYSLTDPNVLDISFKTQGLSKALSNLCPYPFEFDGVQCSSMEAFLQSLKTKDPVVQKDICAKSAVFCYKLRPMYDDWRKTQTLYWRGKEICRHSEEYHLLLTRAYEALLKQSPLFCYALKKAKENNYILKHSIGCKDPSETILTPDEYMALLEHLMSECL